MMKSPKVGDLSWSQVSMWDSSPKDCVEKYEKSLNGEHIFHFVLHRTIEVFSDTHTRFEIPTNIKDIDKSFFKAGADYYIKNDYKKTKIEVCK